MRWIHTADWHLGHTLAGHRREHEHDAFLRFLVEAIVAEDADGLVVAGDIFDQGNPPASAQRAFFATLATLRARCPTLQILVIGGNHDAAGRLDAAAPVLEALGVTMRGGVARGDDGTLDPDRLVVPLREKGGDVVAVAAAIPFLRAPELSLLAPGSTSPVVDGTRAIVGRTVDAARRAWPGVPVVVAAHGELAGARASLASERALFGGDHSLPPSLFADFGVVYGAFGHLHLAQTLDGGRLRYSGSPLPLSMAERDYEHQIVVVDIDAAGARARPLRVPRVVDFWRIPDGPGGTEPVDVVLDRLRSLDAPHRPLEEQPFVDVRVRLDAPVPDLRAQVERALADKHVRLVRIERVHPGAAAGPASTAPSALPGASSSSSTTTTATTLAELSPHAVFAQLYARQFGGPPSDGLADAFGKLLDEVASGAEG